MIKQIGYCAAFLLIFLACFTGVCGVSYANTVKIGLTSTYKEKAEILIKNAEIELGYEDNGVFVPSASITALSAEGFKVFAATLNYVKLSHEYTDYIAALREVAHLRGFGIKCAPGLSASKVWHVYLGGFSTATEAQTALDKIGRSGAVLIPNGKRSALSDGTTQLGATVLFDGDYPQFRGVDDAAVDLSDRKYRGVIEFRPAGINISAINILSEDEYLFGVIPSEMPALWHIEALKAQSVAARTYAVTNAHRHAESGYSLCDGTHCQVYKGLSGEHEAANTAVIDTSGLVIYYDDKPIEALYSASSGGVTEDSENVWTTALPYLRSVPEINENVDVWTKTFTFEQLADFGNLRAEIGVPTAVSATNGANGRVAELTFTGPKGAKTFKGEQTRTVLGLPARVFSVKSGSWSANAATAAKSLYVSAKNFITASGLLSAATLTQTSADGVTFVGKGNGHGVGMSQHGAKGMAEMGYTFTDILKYYYTGVEIR